VKDERVARPRDAGAELAEMPAAEVEV
jgi:hypothetical protein